MIEIVPIADVVAAVGLFSDDRGVAHIPGGCGAPHYGGGFGDADIAVVVHEEILLGRRRLHDPLRNTPRSWSRGNLEAGSFDCSAMLTATWPRAVNGVGAIARKCAVWCSVDLVLLAGLRLDSPRTRTARNGHQLV